MDCYRIIGEDQLAEIAAHEVMASSTDFDGTLRKPMRVAEAEITLGVLAARAGEPEQAVDYGRRALAGERKSLPSLLMVPGSWPTFSPRGTGTRPRQLSTSTSYARSPSPDSGRRPLDSGRPPTPGRGRPVCHATMRLGRHM
jgi:hypothetical protein